MEKSKGDDVTKRCVFRRRLKVPRVSEAVTLGGTFGEIYLLVTT